jgi:hypothetical protein
MKKSKPEIGGKRMRISQNPREERKHGQLKTFNRAASVRHGAKTGSKSDQRKQCAVK